ncbi:uncharacterized protein GGS25DRAFT_508999 [Hypoxylon fragiforme]|uniref:uncharacterized protein n=1 Tax=Hypoxylon fragiforme TaxID=63214 RepID=UPI0020C6F257|nr:uncharacterized protein GGS25DRAFT_508999 [Hypoxylon fragiforme]KAI2602869.1 hypothetical protein GGS25DRAFT_508999 [Hypoxylon fragiforme]
MARHRVTGKSGPAKKAKDGSPPVPFKRPPEVLQPLVETLDEKHVYITHIDSHPRGFKSKIFAVPVLMNLGIVALFVYRIYRIFPYYLLIFASVLGYPNETTMVVDEMEWSEIVPEVATRAFSFMLDFVLVAFVWPWPLEFVLGHGYGNPVSWRLNVGFRDREIVVRRSRKWDEKKGDVVNDASAKTMFLSRIGTATAPMQINEKTGYMLMNADWDLDWAAMVDATTMIDKKMAAIEAFKTVVLLFHEEFGWLCVDMKVDNNIEEDDKRRHVFAFRDALAAVGKEDLFYRWIEIVQFESSQPGGFTSEKQEKVADQIREMFSKQGINFDDLWKESTGQGA